MIRQAGIAACAAGMVLSTGCMGNWQRATSRATHSVSIQDSSLENAESIYIHTVAGDVLLEPTDGPAKVVAKVRATSQERAEATSVSLIVDENGLLDVGVLWPDGKRKRSEGCDLLVYVPTMDGVEIRTSAGDVFVKNMGGLLAITSSAGDIQVHDHSGDALIRTSAGDIDFWNVSGEVDVKTSAGDVSLHSVGWPARVQTSAGDIYTKLNPGFAGTLSASTSAGDVELIGVKYRNKSVQTTIGNGGQTSRFKTSAGDVEVVLDEG